MDRNPQGLGELLRNLPPGLIRPVDAPASCRITALTDDSRRVTPGCLFAARPGGNVDAARFIPDAHRAGAVAVLHDSTAEVPPLPGLVRLAADDVLTALAHLAERFHGNPTARLTLAGVTGTNGKSTTAYLLRQLLGDSCGLISGIEIATGRSTRRADLTTPFPLELSALFAEMVEAGLTHAVMEVSSHALAQGRVAALHFNVGIFTNLTGDHLDYHTSMDDYARAKARLFAMLPEAGLALLNARDPASDIMRRAAHTHTIWTLDAASHSSDADCRAEVASADINGSDVTLRGPWGAIALRLPLIGSHNVFNALAAAAAAHFLGRSNTDIARALAAAHAPPGRLQRIAPPANPADAPAVFVDYAHTDDALVNVLTAIRPLLPAAGRLISVFGCGGDRDRTKRPRMGRAAARHSDAVYITSDNPRTEDPREIINDILRGWPDDAPPPALVEPDRESAIAAAVRDATPADVIIIAGKGHEDYQIIGREKRHFDDAEVASAALRRRERQRA